ERLIRRCLGAFGPATLADICKFAGQVPARIRPVLDRLAPDLRRFADEQGRALFDLPRAPRPKAEVPAPVRFLPRYDEVLIAYQHRDRVIAPRHRPAVYAEHGHMEATPLARPAPELRRFADEQGRALFDLPRAPRPKAEVPAPVRFLPRYDEVLIAYQHRDRVIAPRHRPAIYAKNGIIEATLLVDGFVRGTWDLAASR